jgi:glyoxylate reductase
MKKILVTDSLFIFDKHEQQLRDAGFEIERLDKPEASEEELCEAVKGKVGYILGGIERITDKVIDATDELKVISFTGADYLYFVPGYRKAAEKGIAVTNCPGANANAVSEYAITLILAMVRNVFELGRTGTKTFMTTNSLVEMTIGLVGMGNIGTKVARMLKGLGVQEILYYSRTSKPELEAEIGMKFVELDELVESSDIVSLHAPKSAGDGYFGDDLLSKMKDKAILINTSFESAVDFEALYPELENGRLRAAHDGAVKDERYKSLPLNVWFNSNAHTAYNTHEANMVASDMATQSIINVLTTGKDRYVVHQ